jgi:hypothetical protein
MKEVMCPKKSCVMERIVLLTTCPRRNVDLIGDSIDYLMVGMRLGSVAGRAKGMEVVIERKDSVVRSRGGTMCVLL